MAAAASTAAVPADRLRKRRDRGRDRRIRHDQAQAQRRQQISNGDRRQAEEQRAREIALRLADLADRRHRELEAREGEQAQRRSRRDVSERRRRDIDRLKRPAARPQDRGDGNDGDEREHLDQDGDDRDFAGRPDSAQIDHREDRGEEEG